MTTGPRAAWVAWAAAIGAALLSMLLLDALWLGVLARPWYEQAIGHLMAAQPRWSGVAAFYAVYAAGIVVFGVRRDGVATGWVAALRRGGAFGFFCYAAYDLTNLATLRGWPWSIALLDIAWGVAISALAAAAAQRAWNSRSA